MLCGQAPPLTTLQWDIENFGPTSYTWLKNWQACLGSEPAKIWACLFSCQMELRLRKHGCENCDHVGNILALGNALLKTWAVSVFTLLFGQEDKKQSWRLLLSVKMSKGPNCPSCLKQPKEQNTWNKLLVLRHWLSENKGRWSLGDGKQTRWALRLQKSTLLLGDGATRMLKRQSAKVLQGKPF